MLSRVRLFVTPWAVAMDRIPLSMGFSRQKYWRGFPFPSSGDLPPQGSNPHLLNWQADSLPLSHLGSPFSIFSFQQTSLFLFVVLPMNTVKTVLLIFVSAGFAVLSRNEKPLSTRKQLHTGLTMPIRQ